MLNHDARRLNVLRWIFTGLAVAAFASIAATTYGLVRQINPSVLYVRFSVIGIFFCVFAVSVIEAHTLKHFKSELKHSEDFLLLELAFLITTLIMSSLTVYYFK